ncbi:MAG TPA: tetratricopeptide repeat protein, partial [Chthoniobacteraceae bacterium]
FAEAHGNAAKLLRLRGRLDDAIAEYREAIRARPDFAEAHSEMGLALLAEGKIEEAVAACREGVRLQPGTALTHNNLGLALEAAGRRGEAVEAWREALRLQPDLAEAHTNLGAALRHMGKPDEAIAAYREALRLQPDAPPVHNNLGNAYKDQGRLDLALPCFRRAVELLPDSAEVESNLVYVLHFHPDYDAHALLAESGRWEARHARKYAAAIRPHANDPDPARRLRIGYVSPDFRSHVVGYNVLPLLQAHDHEGCEIFCYSSVSKPDEMTGRLRGCADVWREIARVGDDRAAEMIREDRIDILVDLTLHMAANRLLVFARKPAPIQVTYLGYCGTTGMSAMDYRLSDPFLDPPDGDDSCSSEQTIRLPRSYWCYQPIGPCPDLQPAPMLDAGFVTFGCLNNFAKVSPAALDLWAEILEATPQSRLLLSAPPGSCREEIVARFATRDISAGRLEFVGKQPWEQYIRNWQRIDIGLDPFPYGGGITTCDALWMGTPVVSLRGRAAVGRGGCSILSNLGLPDLIAETTERYKEIAVSLANDCSRLSASRSSLRERMASSPLRDAERFARDVESVYRGIWRTWCIRGSSK